MATSSSYDYSLSTTKLINTIYRKLGILGQGQSISSIQQINAIEAINLLMKQYPAIIEKTWGITEVVQALQSPTIYESSGDSSIYYEAIKPHTTSSSNRPTSGSGWLAYYKLTSTAGVTWSSGQSAVSKNTYAVDTSIVEIKNVRLKGATTETTLEPVSRENFKSYSLLDEGTPKKFYFEKLPTSDNSYIYLYPSPTDVSNYVLIYDAIKYPQDIDNANNDIDFPQEWYQVIVYGAAVHLAIENPVISSTKIQTLKALYEEALLLAQALDSDTDDLQFGLSRGITQVDSEDEW